MPVGGQQAVPDPGVQPAPSRNPQGGDKEARSKDSGGGEGCVTQRGGEEPGLSRWRPSQVSGGQRQQPEQQGRPRCVPKPQASVSPGRRDAWDAETAGSPGASGAKQGVRSA